MFRRSRGPGRDNLWPLAFIILIPLTVLGTLFAIGAAVKPFSFDFETDNTLPPPPPPSQYGTATEVGTRGDVGNPRALFHGEFPSDSETQERKIGGGPARFSGYTTWVRSVTREPARNSVRVLPGAYLRARVQVFNRDQSVQHVCACDFYVWTRTAGVREADAVPRPVVAADAEMTSGKRKVGNVYLYVGTVPGPYFIVYNPDAHVAGHSSTARGVWKVPA
jgi:hypothetical protein